MSDSTKQREAFEAKIQEYVGVKEGPPGSGPDLVNEPMIRHWCETLGDENPVYVDPNAAKDSVHGGIVAPPTMLQAWVMVGYPMHDPALVKPNKQNELHALFDEHGYTGVVATDTTQEYTRYLHPGDQVTAETTIESISEQKATALGIGYFIETRTVFSDQNGEDLGWMSFRVLKFQPGEQPTATQADDGAPAKPTRIVSPRGHDNAWWWEACDKGKLLIQKCSSCGALRHPPRPMCGKCQSTAWESIESSGNG
jgi:acyl dehydratase/ribosomal protein S27AE